MKLIPLNIWGGRLFEPLMAFLRERAGGTDILCFQEVFHTPTDRKTDAEGARVNILAEIKEVLPGFQAFYAPAQENCDSLGFVDYNLSLGLAMFVRKEIKVEEHGDTFVYLSKNSRKDDHTSLGRNLEYITFIINKGKFAVFNLHGLWNGKGKTDTEDRIDQSRKTKDFMNKFKGRKKILCGDFNLLPETESLSILNEGMRNLVGEFGVTSTRSRFYTRPDKFADYILVSPEVEVKNFEVFDDEVSDHLPLLLEFQ